MSGWCAICRQMQPWDEIQQILPCFHYFCQKCLKKYEETSKSTACPYANCCSPIRVADDVLYNACENDDCNRKMAFAGGKVMIAVVCKHRLCLECFVYANTKIKKVCPLSGCEAMLNEEDVREKCEGPCKQDKKPDEMNPTPCCQGQFCRECLEKVMQNGGRCPEGKCIKRNGAKTKKKYRNVRKQNCLGSAECDNEPLMSWPSSEECEHEMCEKCLLAMLNEAEKENTVPRCPNESCMINYRIATVRALRTMFTDKAKYFDKLELDTSQTVDDSETPYKHVPRDFNPTVREIDVKVMLNEQEDTVKIIQFDKKGRFLELIREARFALSISPTESIYGYTIRRGEGIDDEHFPIKGANGTKVVEELGFTANTVVCIDTSGVVVAKNEVKK
ncbi:unnamed protein product, partial [Mesorhabditis spiculigera]